MANQCNSVIATISSCNLATPGFSTLAFSLEAKCLCYSGNTWQPQAYDNNWSSCLGYLKTADPTDYSSLGNPVSTPCAAAGNVLAIASTTAKPATTAVDSNLVACTTVAAYASSCGAATPGFSTLSLSVAAKCLCYSAGTWKPTAYDGYFGSCLGYLKTADPKDYSSYILNDGSVFSTPCAAAGNVLAVATTPAVTSAATTAKPASSTTPVVTTPAVVSTSKVDPNVAACSTLAADATSCQAATPGFSTLAFTSAAKCLCYAGSSWQPSVYDSAYGGCLSYFKTADPTYYSSFIRSDGTVLTTPCALAGNILAASTTSAKPASSSSVASTDLNLAACATISADLSACSVATSGFSNLAFSSQAKCLCYSQSSWVPTSFDKPFGSCLGYLKTADPSDYSSYVLSDGSVFSTPCAAAGNVLAIATPSATPSQTPVVSSQSSASSTSSPTTGSSAGGQTGSLNTPTPTPSRVSRGSKLEGSKWMVALVVLSSVMALFG